MSKVQYQSIMFIIGVLNLLIVLFILFELGYTRIDVAETKLQVQSLDSKYYEAYRKE